MNISDAQVHALRDLANNGGEGAIDKRGVLVAGGERLPYQPETWLRLMTTEHVEVAGPLRIRITSQGRDEVEIARHARARVRPETIQKPVGRKGVVRLSDLMDGDDIA